MGATFSQHTLTGNLLAGDDPQNKRQRRVIFVEAGGLRRSRIGESRRRRREVDRVETMDILSDGWVPRPVQRLWLSGSATKIERDRQRIVH